MKRNPRTGLFFDWYCVRCLQAGLRTLMMRTPTYKFGIRCRWHGQGPRVFGVDETEIPILAQAVCWAGVLEC